MRIKKGNVLNEERGIIVHGCNCYNNNGMPVFGAGIAREIRERFPSAYQAQEFVIRKRGSLTLGNISTAMIDRDMKYIINANTQQETGYGRQVSYDAVDVCFRKVKEFRFENELDHLPVIFPMIGAGLGGGSWRVIQTIIEEIFPDPEDTTLFVLE